MNLLDLYKRKVSICNWQIGILKFAVLSLGIALGCYFADFFRPYLLALIVISVITSVWITAIWLKAMQEKPNG